MQYRKIYTYILLIICSMVSSLSGYTQHNDTVESLLNRMTLDEKIGQLGLYASGRDETGPAMNNDDLKRIREGRAGAVLNAFSVEWTRELQRLAVEETRLGIPLIFGLDVIHGYRTIFPIPLAQSCTWDPELIRQSERIAATEATAAGINWTFAPMVDIARDPRWGRVSEGAGEDPFLGSAIARARVEGFQGDDLSLPNTLMACCKHFAAYGAAQAGRDYHTADISEITLHDTYLPPFKACIDADCGSIMTSFNEINGIPSTANAWLLTDILKKQWGFDGFVVTDWTSLNELVPHGIANDLKDAARLSMIAGVDMDMEGDAYHAYLANLVRENRITMNQLDDAVRRVLHAKAKLGLFDDPYRYCNKEREQTEIFTTENRAFARNFASKSCVLLKNDRQTLPIPPGIRTIAVIGPLGDSREDMLGNWAARGDPKECITLLQGIKNHVGPEVQVTYERGCNTNDTAQGGFSAAVKAASEADFVLLALGENGWMSGEASSRSDIDLPGIQNELAEAILKIGKPTAVVLFNGRPLAISRLAVSAPAILEAWFGGTEAGNGIADILFGKVNPSGKLTMTFPRNEGQIPIYCSMKSTGRPYNPENPKEKYVSRYLDVPNDPLFPFGYGLSYTSFAYSDPEVQFTDDTIRISVSITNTGDRDGEEIVQLYTRDLVGSITRPVKELKGFRKIHLQKNTTGKVVFMLTRNDLAFWHPDGSFSFEPGEFEIFVGTNSVQTRSAKIRIP